MFRNHYCDDTFCSAAFDYVIFDIIYSVGEFVLLEEILGGFAMKVCIKPWISAEYMSHSHNKNECFDFFKKISIIIVSAKIKPNGIINSMMKYFI